MRRRWTRKAMWSPEKYFPLPRKLPKTSDFGRSCRLETHLFVLDLHLLLIIAVPPVAAQTITYITEVAAVTFHLKHLSHKGRSLLNISKSECGKKTRLKSQAPALGSLAWHYSLEKNWGYETIHNPRKHHALLNSNTNLYPLPTCIPAMRQLSPPTHPTHPIVTNLNMLSQWSWIPWIPWYS